MSIVSTLASQELLAPVRQAVAAPVEAAADDAARKLTRDQWRRALGTIPDPAPGRLAAEAGAEKLGGWQPKVLAHEVDGARRYLVKPVAPGSASVELQQAVTRLRRSLGFPSAAVEPGQVTLADGNVMKGSAKEMLDASGTLDSNPARWTPAQRNAVMMDDPWLRLLGNHDSHVRQYVRVRNTTLNVDWDSSFDPTVAEPALSRFRQSHWYAPTAQTLLYRAYAKGEVELNLNGLVRIADRIAAMSDADFLAALKPFERKAFAAGRPYGPYATPADFEKDLLSRKSSLPAAYRQLAADLRKERAEGPLQHPVNYLKDHVAGAVEAFNASPAYKTLSKFMQRLNAKGA